jgi:hypothetical protein
LVLSALALATPCQTQVDAGVLPAWARAGFSSPKPRIPHVLGARGHIVAILFGYPLRSPPAQDRNNKILWVARVVPPGRSDLRIAAQRWDAGRPIGAPVTRRVDPGPGPSIVDLPAAGCWRLTLRWAGRIDTLDLDYSSP